LPWNKHKIVLALAFAAGASADTCPTASNEKVDCAFSGIDEQGCYDLGCCWAAVDGDPYCFNKVGGDSAPSPAPVPMSCTSVSSEKTDCASSGIDEQGCHDLGCCWAAVDGDPYCYYQEGMVFPTPAPLVSCFALVENATEPFSASEVQTMRNYFLANINIEGFGTVVAGFNGTQKHRVRRACYGCANSRGA